MRAPEFHIGELSRRTGVSRDLLRAWERRYALLSPTRTDGGFRRYSAEDVLRVRLMQHYLRQGLPARTAAELVERSRSAAGPDHPGIPPQDAVAAIATLEAALERFDQAPAEVALNRLLKVFTPQAVLSGVVLPYMRGVGERWACGETTIAQEHFATAFLEGRLLLLAHGWGRGGGPCAVLACPPGEQHVLGLIAFGIVLRDLGWRVVYLGRDTPLTAAADAAKHVDADALVLGVTVAGDVVAHAERLLDAGLPQHVVAGGHAAGVLAGTGVTVLPGELGRAAEALDALAGAAPAAY